MNADGSMIYFSEQTDYLTSNGGALNRDDVLLSTSDLDGNGLNDIILTDGIRVHTYYNLDQDNWQMDIIATDIHGSNGGFLNADGSMIYFSEQTDYLTYNGGALNRDDVLLSTSDLDGNGLNDIILTDGIRVHTYYNLGQDNWQMDVIATGIHGSNGGFMNADGSITYFSEQTDYLTYNGGALNRDDVLLSTSDLDGNGLNDIILTDGIRVHAYYNLDQDNWQMDIIATDIHGSNGGFMNADGSMIYFSEQTDYLTSNGGALNRDDVLLSTSDLDGNGLNDIILTDGIRVHAYYNLDQDNWQMDIIATDIHGSNGGFMNADGSMIYFSEQTDYLTSNGGALNRDDVLLSTSDLDGNGLNDIILTDGIRVTS